MSLVVLIAVFVAVFGFAASAFLLTQSAHSGESQDEVRHLIVSETGEANVGLKEGNVAPNFVDNADNSFSLVGLRGKVVVLDFAITRCGYCAQEMEHLKVISSRYSAQDVAIITIIVDPWDADNQIIREREYFEIDWPMVSGTDVGVRYNFFFAPTLYIVDREGVIASRSLGVVSAEDISSVIDGLL